MRRTAWALIGLLGALLFSGGSIAEEIPDLFISGLQNRFMETRPGVFSARFNADRMGAMSYGDKARFSIPGKADYLVEFQRLVRHANGDTTWIGNVSGSADHQAVITQGAVGAVGQIRTPNGKYLVEAEEGGRLVDPDAAGLKEAPVCAEDPPAKKAGPDAIVVDPSADNQFSASTTIDLMVLYTPGFSPGSATTKINQLVALANQAYINSNVDVQLRVVHTQQVSYSETTSNSTALDALTDGTDPALSSIASLRTQKGADLVALIRPYSDTNHGSCGVAWVLGSGGTPMDPSGGYAVISYGSSGSYYCHDITLAHEIGHNMGSAHDRAHASVPGIYPYSYGYGVDTVFGTIMSYIRPTVEKFSNPAIYCTPGVSQPCGIVETNTAQAANNRLSLTNTKATVAAFRSSTQAVTLTGITLTPASVMLGMRSLISPLPADASLGTCTSGNTAVATISGSYATGVSLGSALITCGSVSATLTVIPVSLTGIDLTPSPLTVGQTATISPIPSSATLGACTSSDATVATVSGASVLGIKAGATTIACGSYSKSLSVIAATLTGISLSPATVTVGATATIVPTPTGAALGTCSSSNQFVATVSGDKVTGVNTGSAIVTCGAYSATVTVQSGFVPSSTASLDASGNVRLVVSFTPVGSDVGKNAEIFVAASTVQDGKTVWYSFDGSGWRAGLNLVPLATKVLVSPETGYVVLNNELPESLLRALKTDIYVAYRPVGSDQLTYGIAKSFF